MSTALEKRKAVEREIGYRRRVYAGLVNSGRMSQQEASRQIEIFEEIAEDYRKLEPAERLL